MKTPNPVRSCFLLLPLVAPLASAQTPDLLSRATENDAAYIPPQCYTATIDRNGVIHNPCYSCHQDSDAPNYAADSDLQIEYIFPEYARTNRWRNLFVDRTQAVRRVSDQEIKDYVAVDNYRDAEGHIILAEKLADLPAEWDYDGDGHWDGFVPDCYFDFDEEGFDRAPDGSDTGWRAFAYYPFLGTFWPTNGSTDDVIIRLPEAMRQDEAGRYDRGIYKVNLAIVEALIKRTDVDIEPTDEGALGVDLDQDGVLGIATRVAFDWAPQDGRDMSYVGLARLHQQSGRLHLAAGLFPEGTAFLHSVRYIGEGEDGDVALAPRMKELRYGKKVRWVDYATLSALADLELTEKQGFPDRLRTVLGDMERGLSNDMGWIYQGFIEDAGGNLRPQSYEETVFCMGCHGVLGGTTDTVFAFPRKLDTLSFQGGWFHWTQRGLRGLPDPLRSDGLGEYETYLRENGAGDEFRSNGEIRLRFFKVDGSLREPALEALREDVAALLYPSPRRALTLNKAYREIVREQSFIHGRDATVRTPLYLRLLVDENEPTGILAPLDNP